MPIGGGLSEEDIMSRSPELYDRPQMQEYLDLPPKGPPACSLPQPITVERVHGDTHSETSYCRLYARDTVGTPGRAISSRRYSRQYQRRKRASVTSARPTPLPSRHDDVRRLGER